MWIQFWCLIPSKFTSALPQTSCAVCFPQSNISQQVVPMYSYSCPFVPQLHLPSASSPYSLVVFETFLTKPSTWTVLHNDVEGEIRVSWFSRSSSVVSLASPMQISCPERYLKWYQTPWLRHLGHSEPPPLAVTHSKRVPSMKKETLHKYSSGWSWVRFTSSSKKWLGRNLQFKDWIMCCRKVWWQNVSSSTFNHYF